MVSGICEGKVMNGVWKGRVVSGMCEGEVMNGVWKGRVVSGVWKGRVVRGWHHWYTLLMPSLDK